jgi:hypothetical protein
MTYVLTSVGYTRRERERVKFEKNTLDRMLRGDTVAQKQIAAYASGVAAYYDKVRRDRRRAKRLHCK